MTELSVNTPVYHSHSKDLREQLMNEMLYIVHHAKESPFHLIGHLYLFLDYLTQSAKSKKLVQSSKMSDYYIKEAINYIEQNFQNHITAANGQKGLMAGGFQGPGQINHAENLQKRHTGQPFVR